MKREQLLLDNREGGKCLSISNLQKCFGINRRKPVYAHDKKLFKTAARKLAKA